MAVPARPPIVIDHPFLQLALPGDFTPMPEQEGLFAAYERPDHSAFNVVLMEGPPGLDPRTVLEQMLSAHAASLARNHPQQMDAQPPQFRTVNGITEATRTYLCRAGGPPWRVTSRYATTIAPVGVGGRPFGHPIVQITVYESPWASDEMQKVISGATIVPLAQKVFGPGGPLAPPPERQTRWVWIVMPGGERILAFTYSDPMAGPSAKGAVVTDPAAQAQIRNAIDLPDRTVRDPDAFGAVPIGAEEALRLGLPKDPPWIGHFENKPVPPPRGEPSRDVTVFVRRNGELVRGAKVRIGDIFGQARELGKLDERIADATGRCDFPLAPMKPIGAIATLDNETSKLVEVPVGARSVVLEMVPVATLYGEVRKDGRLVPGQISISSKDGGMHRVERTDDEGRYRIDGIVPGRYTIEVHGIHPRTRMSAGTPVLAELVIEPGARLLQSYTLLSGRTIRIAAAAQHQDHRCVVYLLAGQHAPQLSSELKRLCDQLGRDGWRSANAYGRRGDTITTELLDVTPGTYSVCVEPSGGGNGILPDQVLTCRTIIVAGEDVDVELVVPAYRPPYMP